MNLGPINFKKLKRLFCLSVLLAILSIPSYAQQFDYQKYPKLDFSFDELVLDVTVNPDNRNIKGKAEYRVLANIDGLDSLILHATHMEIASVSVNSETAAFHMQNDSLFIGLPDSSEAGESYSVSIDYTTIPRFGILKNDRSIIWTSLLPQSQSHWYPVVDHPRVTFNSNITITVPSGHQAVASGVKLRKEILEDGQVSYSYKTRNDIPATSLAFAAGQFDQDETSLGVKKISLNSEKGLLNDSVGTALLDETLQTLNAVEQELDMKFPYERLNLVVLKDHFWETQSWGASTVFLYQNRGNLLTQLRRGIIAQWFGVFQREEQWADGEVMNLLQTALENQLSNKSNKLDIKDHPGRKISTYYDTFGPGEWNTFQDNFDKLDSVFREMVLKSLPKLVAEGEGVYNFRDYGEFWYRQNGQPIFELQFEDQETKADSMETDSVIYSVKYQQNEGGLELVFTAEQGVYNELITLPLALSISDGADTLQVTFTGSQDTVNIQAPALTENAQIITAGMPRLILEQQKPVSFLLYQLGNAETVDERVEAAKMLSHHSDDPDLQFAIKKYMSQELDPETRAALLKSYGDITNGASGTEGVFLEALQSEEHAISDAGLTALQHYSGNAAIQERIKQYATNTDSMPSFKKAVGVFSAIADSAFFEDFVSSMVSSDTAGYKAIFVIQELANNGNVNKAVRQAEFYISDVYEYPVRASALSILFQHDNSTESWEGRVEELLADADPRIRYLTVLNLPKIEELNYTEMLNTLVEDEYDQRVYQAIEGIISNE